MKVFIHDFTPKRKEPKYIKYVFAFFYVFFLFIFAAMFFYIKEHRYLLEIPLFLFLLALPLCVYIKIDRLCNSYIDYDGEIIYVVEYKLFGKKEKFITVSEIHHNKRLPANDPRLRSSVSSGFEYIVFFDKDNNQLFKLLYTPVAEEFSQALGLSIK